MKLSNEQIRLIEAKALTLIEDACGKEDIEPPINLKKILESCGLSLKEGSFGGGNVAGAYDRDKREIYIETSDSPKRKQFTIAHEIGHFILHQTKEREVFYRTQFLNIDTQDVKEETEANWFAASLLMPKPTFLKYWKIIPDESALADIFGVSPVAVHWRAVNLGLSA